MIHTSLVLLMFFFSGMAGLLYQVVWVREFGQIFGNTIHSASLVSGVFVSGLGIGSLLAGIVADRRYTRQPESGLRLYAYAEFGIAALGVVVLLLLGRLEAVSATASTYQIGEHGWHELTTTSYLFRYTVALVMLTPATLLMGGTLTLLIRFLVSDQVQAAGWRVGILYGVNTAGAAIACLGVDLFAIPNLGLTRTQLLAVGLNLFAGLGAFALIPRSRSLVLGAGASEQNSRGWNPDTAPGDVRIGFIAAAVTLSGFAAMGMEILWFRHLTSSLGAFRIVFSLLLFTILTGLWIGAVCAGWISRRDANPAKLLIASQFCFAAATLGALYTYDLDIDALVAEAKRSYIVAKGQLGVFYELRVMGLPILQLVGVPAFFMGFSYPLANAIVQRAGSSVGRRAGVLYLGNALGSVAGSILTGFVLLPRLGVKWSAAALAACALLVILPLIPAALATPQRRRAAGLGPLLVGALGCGAAGLIAWSAIPGNYFVLQPFRSKPALQPYLESPYLLAASEGLSENIVIIHSPGEGKTLYTNSHPMSRSTTDAHRYMRAFSHLPLLQLDTPQDVLVICFGVGNTAHAASLHTSVENLEVVDISRHVVSHAHHFSDTNQSVLDDPRVSVFINDGRQHLRMRSAESYDLVTLEPPPIQFSGVGSLYSREFYELVARGLKPGGFVSQWLPVRQLPESVIRSAVRAFLEVFPNSVMLNGSREEYLILGRKGERIEFDPAAVARRISANPALASDLERYQLGNLTELVAMFAGDANSLDAGVRGIAALTDDTPLMEYSRIWFEQTGIPTDLFDVERVATWCPQCFEGDEPAPAVEDLITHLQILDALYDNSASPRARERRSARVSLWGRGVAPRDYRRVLRSSPYLRDLRAVKLIPGPQF